MTKKKIKEKQEKESQETPSFYEEQCGHDFQIFLKPSTTSCAILHCKKCKQYYKVTVAGLSRAEEREGIFR